MFDLRRSTGILFTYVPSIPHRSHMQMVDFTIDLPFTSSANVLTIDVSTVAMLGKTIEQMLVDHVEHYEAIAAGSSAAGE
jgi:hypothetical protein